jgi:hypothetical protein
LQLALALTSGAWLKLYVLSVYDLLLGTSRLSRVAMARISKFVLPISMLRRDSAHASVECAIKLKVGSGERGAACDEGSQSWDDDFAEKSMLGVNLRASAELTLWGVSGVRGRPSE